jgi:hypothetical protein
VHALQDGFNRDGYDRFVADARRPSSIIVAMTQDPAASARFSPIVTARCISLWADSALSSAIYSIQYTLSATAGTGLTSGGTRKAMTRRVSTERDMI